MANIVVPFQVQKQGIVQHPPVTLACGGSNYFTARFCFCDSWDGIGSCKAIFIRDEQSLVMSLQEIDGYATQECEIPWEVMQTPGTFHVGVFGGDMLPTVLARVTVDKGCRYLSHNESTPKPPTTTWVEDIEAAVDSAVVKSEKAVATVNGLEQLVDEAGAIYQQMEQANAEAAKQVETAQSAATEAEAQATVAKECAQAMAGTFDFTGYLRYQIVDAEPDTYEDGVLYIVADA